MNPSPAAPPLLSPDEARAWWYGLINFEQRTPSASDLKLDHMRVLSARLGDPHRRLRILHVAGSKGKGSTAAMLASILRRRAIAPACSPRRTCAASRSASRWTANRSPRPS